MKKQLKIVVFLLILHGSVCQDANTRLENFIKLKLTGLPAWLRENGLIPYRLEDSGQFSFSSSADRGMRNSLEGNVWNRTYHGAENNITARSISANLDTLSFFIDLGFGGGSSDFVIGKYDIDGRSGFGSGKFTRSVQTTIPLHFEFTCVMEVTPEGYFNLIGFGGSGYTTDFAELTLEGFEGFTRAKDLFHSVLRLQFDDHPDTHRHFYFYMEEVFAKTPIEDIIGETLPPTIASSAKTPLKNVDELVFDEKRQSFLRHVSYNEKLDNVLKVN